MKYPENVAALKAKLTCDQTVVDLPQSISPFISGKAPSPPSGAVVCGTITVSASSIGPYNVTGPLPVAIGDVTMSASGGTSPYTWSVSSGSLPPTTSINSSSGIISGDATTVGNYTATITATDANSPSCTGTADVNFNVSAF